MGPATKNTAHSITRELQAGATGQTPKRPLFWFNKETGNVKRVATFARFKRLEGWIKLIAIINAEEQRREGACCRQQRKSQQKGDPCSFLQQHNHATRKAIHSQTFESNVCQGGSSPLSEDPSLH
uniref:Uncharacterized protein n=1 Tax=Pyxicephalus adspersus TaxID=30357 RepID=A0AAV3ALB1_PYXAD|nr:TPA: hypothetical protein GDO54_011471 [Pyxicephalus adspersus]